MDQTYPDETRVIETISWICVGVATAAVIARSIIKAKVIRKIGADDVFIWAALICFVGQCVALQFQVYNGLGQHIKDANLDELDKEMRAEYADILLYMPILAFSKLSVVSLFRKFAYTRRDQLLLYGFEWFLAAWGISSEFASAFQCHLPMPWKFADNSCINRAAWVTYFEIVNIVTDLALIILPILVVARLATSWGRRLTAMFFFASRVFIIPASVARVIYWIYEGQTVDLTWNLFPFVIASILVATLEILSACVLYMRPLFDILELGFALSYDPTNRDPRNAPTYGPYSVGTWPFTHIQSPDAFLTGRQTEYRADISALPDDEKAETGSDTSHIHISQQVEVRRSPPVRQIYHKPSASHGSVPDSPPPPLATRREKYDRTRIPSMNTNSLVRPPSLDKSLPPTPEIQKGTYLLP